ncbi:MAG: hypothetical protein ACK5KP_08830 [Paludibacteraceae bacterium]
MKSTSVVFFALLISINLFSIEGVHYIQFSGGAALRVLGDEPGIFLSGEYGKTYNWLDLGIAMNYETQASAKDYRLHTEIYVEENGEKFEPNMSSDHDSFLSSTSLSFNARANIIKFFVPDSKHFLKIGGGLGLASVQTMSSTKDSYAGINKYYFLHSSKIEFLPTLMLNYEYAITEKMMAGVFLYGGKFSPCIGLSIRRNF